MTRIKKIIEIIWTIWCLLSATILILISFPIVVIHVLIFNENKRKNLDIFVRVIAKIIMNLWGIKQKFIFEKKLDYNRSYLYVANHKSYLDAFIAILGIKQYKNFIGKSELFNWPIIGTLSKILGNVPVKRESSSSRKKSYEWLVEILNKQISLFICPEGAVYMNDKLINEMRNGGFRAAIESNTPIIVMSIINAGILFPSDKMRIRPGKCITYMSKPIETSNLTINDIDNLREKVKKIILNNLLKYYPNEKYPVEFNPQDYREKVYLDTLNKKK